jgi:hypothetical protein
VSTVAKNSFKHDSVELADLMFLYVFYLSIMGDSKCPKSRHEACLGACVLLGFRCLATWQRVAYEGVLAINSKIMNRVRASTVSLNAGL